MKKLNYFLTFFLCAFALAAQESKSQVLYSLRYSENIRAAYRNLLQKPDSNDFRQYENIWSGSIAVDPQARGNIAAKFILKKQPDPQIPASTQDTAGIFPEFYVSAPKTNQAIQLVCYKNYPGREADVLVKNILATIQSFNWNQPASYVEDYTDGQFPVRYRWKETENKLIVEKEKFSSIQAQDQLNRVIVDSFSCTLEFDKSDTLLRSVKMIEYKHQKIGNQTLAYIRSEMMLVRQAAGAVRMQEEHFMPAASTCLAIYKLLNRKERKEQISRSSLKNIGMKELVQELKTTENYEPRQEFELVSKIKGALYLYPESFSFLSEILSTSNTSDKKYQIAFNAVLASENILAQKYLAGFLQKHASDYSVLRTVLPQVGIMTYVIDTSLLNTVVSFLNEKDGDISSLAGLALSNLSHQYKYVDSSLHRTVNDILYQHYLHLKNDEKLLQYLKQIGNSGDETKTDFLSGFFNNANEQVQLAAISSSRFILQPHMDSLLSEQLIVRRKDSLLSERIYDVISLRFPSAIIRKAIYTFLQERKIELQPVKIKYIDYLKAFADEFPAEKEIAAWSTGSAESDLVLRQLQNFKKWYH